jgi:hypothetical protein
MGGKDDKELEMQTTRSLAIVVMQGSNTNTRFSFCVLRERVYVREASTMLISWLSHFTSHDVLSSGIMDTFFFVIITQFRPSNFKLCRPLA